MTIALPMILARYEVEISTLAWTLTSFNLALALAALPAALANRSRRADPCWLVASSTEATTSISG